MDSLTTQTPSPLNTEIARLEQSTEQLAANILQEQDVEQTKQLIHLFNLHMSKKNVTRLMTLNKLLDDVYSQMAVRLEKKADEFNNSDLVTYTKVLQDSVEKSNRLVNQIDESPVININHTDNAVNINLNSASSLDRDSRERIMDAVKTYLERVQKETVSEKDVIYMDENQYTETENIAEDSGT